MTFGKGKVLKKEEIFTKAKDYQPRRGLKIGVFGPPEAGKTYFGCTCPGPVYVLDTHFGAYPVARTFDKDIQLAEVIVIDERTDEPDAMKSLTMVEDAATSLKDVTEGTVVIDSITDYWGWIGTWLEETAIMRSKKTGKMMQTEWGRGNDRYRKLMTKLLSRPTNLVVIAEHKQVYSDAGKPLGLYDPSWQRQTPYWMDFVINLKKTGTETNPSYYGILDKCRFARGNNIRLEDNTYQELVRIITDVLKVKVPGVDTKG